MHSAIQLVLKSSEKFATSKIEHVNKHSLADEIAGKVLENLHEANLEDLIHQDDRGQATLASNNDIMYTAFRVRVNSRGQRGQIHGNQRNGSLRQQPPRNNGLNKNTRKCRGCQNYGHFVRDFPTRFRQTPGTWFHDTWKSNCPNYDQ